LEKYEKEAQDFFYASARLWDDGFIDPTDMRKVLVCSNHGLLSVRQDRD
jgi:acetyl-CoA carboxylase carboxyltransferase component